MDKLILATAVSLFLIAPAALAVDEHHPVQKGAPVKDAGMPMGKMQDNMLRMHEQMHKIMQTQDPKERERLMQEHMKMMQENMKMMGGGQGGMMGGDGKGATMGAPTGK
jgi:hypothetical protein